MAKSPIKKDPHAEREARKYENPIPSREFILKLLAEADGPMSRNQLTQALELDDYDQAEGLRRRLRAMERDGQLIRGRKGAYGLIDKMDLIRGRVLAHRDGFGFLAPEGGGDDIYLNSRQMNKVFDGDEVLCRMNGENYRGKAEAVIVQVVAHNTQQLVGRFFNENGLAYVVPDNARINHDIQIPADQIADAKPEQYVMVEITRQPGKHTKPAGRITELLGEHMGPGMEIDVAIRSYDIPHVWPDEVLTEAQALESEPTAADKRARVDLRDLPFVTIDGEDARDFDDAVYCEPKPRGGWRLWVAIADVSHYVAVDSALDKEAKVRGNSVYFPEQVVPMLPEALSNGLCSLKPEVDRLCMVCEMTISAKGKLSGYTFFEGIMYSHARLTYTKVGAMLDRSNKDHENLRKQYEPVLPHIEELHSLYKALRIARAERGAIDFETTETRMIFGEDRKIEQIVPVVRNDAHKIIEECMLSANVAAARFLERSNIPALYRVHEGPKDQKLLTLRKYLGELGLELMGGEKPGPKEYQVLMGQIEDRPDSKLIQMMMLRSLRQAVYQPDNEGHFGLNYPGYTHFTSPIRRYPDLLVHRAIRHCVRKQQGVGGTISSAVTGHTKGRKPKTFKYPYGMPELLVAGEQCSLTERRADEATRDVVAWLKCEYLQDRVGEVFDGVVAAVTGFGLFIELVDVYVEGLVHVSSLDRDYYHFDQGKQRLVGERTGKSFHMGDEVVVRVVRVSLDDKKIDLEIIESSSRAKRRESRSHKPEGKNRKPEGKNRKPKGKSHRSASKKSKSEAKSSKEKVSTKAKPKKKPTTAQVKSKSAEKKTSVKKSTNKSGEPSKPAVRKRRR
jgi:ribonuclease R